MLRAIVRRKMTDPRTGGESTTMVTLDFECKELQDLLSGGFATDSYDLREIVGIELLSDQPKPTPLILFEVLRCDNEKPAGRAYVWASSRQHAYQLARLANGNDNFEIYSTTKLFDANSEPFATKFSEHGFERQHDNG